MDSIFTNSLLVSIFVPIICCRASPFTLHYDRKLGCASETIWATYGPLLFGWAFITLIILSGVDSSATIKVAVVFLAIAAICSAVRLGCVMPELTGHRNTSRLLRAVAGTISGLTVAAPATPLIFDEEFTLNSILLVFPIITALAYAYVSIDDEDIVKT